MAISLVLKPVLKLLAHSLMFLIFSSLQIDEDIDVCEFLVQYGSGNLTETENNNGNFCDVYQGPNTSSIVRNLKPNRPYTFRVSCRGDNKGRWSPWSKSVVASTSLHHHGKIVVSWYLVSPYITALL